MPVYRKRFLCIAAFLLIQASASIFVGLVFASTPRENVILPGVFINGIKVGGLDKQEAELLLKRHVSGNSEKKIILKYADRQWNISIGSLNVQYDVHATVEEAMKTGRGSGSLLPSLSMLRTGYRQPNIPLRYSVDEKKLNQVLLNIASQIECPGTDAKIVTEGRFIKVIKENTGKKFNMRGNKAKLESAVGQLQEKPVLLDVTDIKPKIRTADLAEIKDQLGTGIMFLPAWQEETARTVGIAASSLDGTVIRPGEKFSLKKAITANYDGRLNEDACRAASALYQAALYSGIDVTERLPHPVLPPYAAPGQDAAIHTDSSDLMIHNTTGNPLYVQAFVRKNNIIVNILGYKKNGQTIQLLTERKAAQDGATETFLYRVFYQDGKKLKTELISRDIYRTN